jgi:glycerol-3-phosphate dehydrogenase
LDKLNYYGSDAEAIRQLVAADKKLDEPLDTALPYTAAMVVWACRQEMARTVEDVLSRRTRALLLNAKASIDAAPTVAAIMAKELRRDRKWRDAQVKQYGELAKHYLLK